MAFPIAAVLAAATSLGGILMSKDGRKTIDPEVLKKLFGPQAITAEAMEMFNSVINSPQGQQMMTQAAQSGQSFGNSMNQALGKAGFGGAGDGSAIAAFSGAAAGEAANSMQRGVRGQIYSDALGAASQNVNNRMGIWAGSQQQQQATPTFGQQMGSALLGAGAQAAAMIPSKAGVATPVPQGMMNNVQPAGPAPSNSGYFGGAGTSTGGGYGRIGQRRKRAMN